MRDTAVILFAGFAMGAGIVSLIGMVVHGMIADAMARSFEAGKRQGRAAAVEEVDPADRWKLGRTDLDEED